MCIILSLQGQFALNSPALSATNTAAITQPMVSPAESCMNSELLLYLKPALLSIMRHTLFRMFVL